MWVPKDRSPVPGGDSVSNSTSSIVRTRLAGSSKPSGVYQLRTYSPEMSVRDLEMLRFALAGAVKTIRALLLFGGK